MKQQYIIILQATSNNSFGLSKNNEYYAAGWAGTDYTDDLSNAFRVTDLKTLRKICNNINAEKNFKARICELNWSIGNFVN